MMLNYHKPVLLNEAISYLNIIDNGIYVDATLGGGSHSQAILNSNGTIRLFSFDQDFDAISHVKTNIGKNNGRWTLIHDNFVNLWTQLSLQRIKKINGILFDLGISSHQIDTGDKGFSFMLEGNLDMRMNANDKLTAFDIINQFEESKLTEIFWNLGEEREAKRIAKAIVAQRAFNTIKTTLQLADIIDFATQSHQKMKAKARIFQALRIFINRELDVLQKTLQDAVRLLHPDGRIVVISYHSLEDRIVKRFFREEEKECTCPEFVLQCNCKKKSTLKLITKKPVIPSELEKNENSRSRSAKMRVAEKRG